MGFKDFKNKMKSTESSEKLASSFEQKSYVDGRYWKPTVDKNGNANCVIRFLPAGGDEEEYFVTMLSYAFQNEDTKQWYIENSLRTINQDDPCAQKNSELWNTGLEENQALVRKRAQKTNYISNVLVIRDPDHPENEGKVFLYKYGKAVMKKIKDAIKPEFADETPINPFNMWEGANFKLRMYKEAGGRFPTYDKCAFEAPSALFDGDDEKIESEVYNKLYPLQPEIAPNKFKTYAELKERLAIVNGEVIASTASKVAERSAPNPDFKESVVEEKKVEAPKEQKNEDLDDDIMALLD